jgi:hypothetical protein
MGDVAYVVKFLLCKYKALSSNPMPPKRHTIRDIKANLDDLIFSVLSKFSECYRME